MVKDIEPQGASISRISRSSGVKVDTRRTTATATTTEHTITHLNNKRTPPEEDKNLSQQYRRRCPDKGLVTIKGRLFFSSGHYRRPFA
jgi:hypothetical protein